MKTLLIGTILTAQMAFCATQRTWPQLPDGMLPDSEISTNVALNVDTARLRVFSIKLEATSCASNEVVVAIGCDADSDGDLSLDEAALAVGCECGERYLVDYASGNVVTNIPDTVCISWRNFNPAWNLAKVVKRGTGSVGEVITETIENKQFSIRLR